MSSAITGRFIWISLLSNAVLNVVDSTTARGLCPCEANASTAIYGTEVRSRRGRCENDGDEEGARCWGVVQILVADAKGAVDGYTAIV